MSEHARRRKRDFIRNSIGNIFRSKSKPSLARDDNTITIAGSNDNGCIGAIEGGRPAFNDNDQISTQLGESTGLDSPTHIEIYEKGPLTSKSNDQPALNSPESVEPAQSDRNDSLQPIAGPDNTVSTDVEPAPKRKVYARHDPKNARKLPWVVDNSSAPKVEVPKARNVAKKLTRKVDDVTKSEVDANVKIAKPLLRLEGAQQNTKSTTDKVESSPLSASDQIYDWATDPSSRPMFVLSGERHSDKDIIARSIAHNLEKYCKFTVASFCFEQSDFENHGPLNLFSGIGMQLSAKVPGLEEPIGSQMKIARPLVGSSLEDQFNSMLIHPLLSLEMKIEKTIVVVDGLGECPSLTHADRILAMLSELSCKQRPGLKVLVTTGKYHTVEAALDRSTFVYEVIPCTDKSSTTMKTKLQGNLDPVASLSDSNRPSDDTEYMIEEFFAWMTARSTRKNVLSIREQQHRRNIVGSMVFLATPVSTTCLSRLLNLPVPTIEKAADGLDLVLDVPKNRTSPIKLIHESFREYMITCKRSQRHEMSVDSERMHLSLAHNCLDLLSGPNGLKQDICGVVEPGTERSTVRNVKDVISEAISYACRNWIWHLSQANDTLVDSGRVHVFLQTHLLHWLEAMSWLGNTPGTGSQIQTLLGMLPPGEKTNLGLLLEDAHHFILKNLCIIAFVPLQIYASALIFAPANSLIKKMFHNSILISLNFMPQVSNDWNHERKPEIENRTASTGDFATDGKWVVYTLRDKLSWCTKDMSKKRSHRCESLIKGVKFLHGVHGLATFHDKNVRFWSLEFRTRPRGFKFPRTIPDIFSVDITSAGDLLVLGTRTGLVVCLNVAMRDEIWRRRQEGNPFPVCVKITPDDSMVAVSSSNGVELIDLRTSKVLRDANMVLGLCRWTSNGAANLAFSPDQNLLAASNSTTIAILCTTTMEQIHLLSLNDGVIRDVTFSRDSGRFAFSCGRHAHMVSTSTWKHRRTIQRNDGSAEYVLLGNDFGSMSNVRDALLVQHTGDSRSTQTQTDRVNKSVNDIRFSEHGHLLVSVSDNGLMESWAPDTGEMMVRREYDCDSLANVVLAPDCDHILTASERHKSMFIRSVDSPSTSCRIDDSDCLDGNVSFSPDTRYLYLSHSDGLKVYDCTDWSSIRDICYEKGMMAFLGPTGGSLSLAGESTDIDGGNVNNTESMQAVGFTESDSSKRIVSVIFSPDQRFVATTDVQSYIELWSNETGKQLCRGRGTTWKSGKCFSHPGSLFACVDAGAFYVWHISAKRSEYVLATEYARDTTEMVIFHDRWLASISCGTLYVMDMSTHVTVWRLNGLREPHRLETSGRFLKTSTFCMNVESEDPGDWVETISREDGWIRRGGKNVLWLPTELRGTDDAHGEWDTNLHPVAMGQNTACHNNTIAIGQQSGSVTIISFKD